MRERPMTGSDVLPLPHLTGGNGSGKTQHRINLLLPVMVLLVGGVLCSIAYQQYLQIGQFQSFPWLNPSAIFGVFSVFISIQAFRQWLKQRKEDDA